jgi:hypothetical protein
VQDTLGDAAHQFGLGGAQRGGGGILVARCDRFLDFAQVGADARAAGLVDLEAALVLAGALLGWGELAMSVPFPGSC